MRLISVAFCAAMPRCLSRSSGSSVTRRARIDALRIGQLCADTIVVHGFTVRAFVPISQCFLAAFSAISQMNALYLVFGGFRRHFRNTLGCFAEIGRLAARR